MVNAGYGAYRHFVAGEPDTRIGDVVGLAHSAMLVGRADQYRVPQPVQAPGRDAPGRQSSNAKQISACRTEQEAASPDDRKIVVTGHRVAARKLRIGRSLAAESQFDQKIALGSLDIATHEPELDIKEIDEQLLRAASVGNHRPHLGQERP